MFIILWRATRERGERSYWLCA